MTTSYVFPTVWKVGDRVLQNAKRDRGLCALRRTDARWFCAHRDEEEGSRFSHFPRCMQELVNSLKSSRGNDKRGVRVERIEIDARDAQNEIPLDVLKELIGSDMMRRIYFAVANEVTDVLEKAKKIFATSDDCQEGMSALVQLLEMARYRALSSEDARRREALEGCADQLPVFISSTGFDEKFLLDGVSSDGILGLPEERVAFFPQILIAWKGVTIQKKDGRQLKAKLRGFEAKYFGWIDDPFDWIIAKLAKGRNHDPKDDSKEKTPIGQSGAPEASEKHIIERISPSRTLELGVDSLVKLFQPIHTEEPAYRSLCIIYRGLSGRNLQQPYNVVKELKVQLGKQKEGEDAVNHTNRISTENEQRSDVNIDVLSDVPWAALNNYLPGRYLSFAAKDILRLDAFTLAGLVAAVTTYIQDFGTFYVGFTLTASLIYYGSRVFLSIQSAWNSYHRKIISDILNAVVGRGRGGLLAIADEAVHLRFTEACLLLHGMDKNNSLKDAAESATRYLKSKHSLDFTFVDGGVGGLDTLHKLGLVNSRAFISSKETSNQR
eukprot:Plantae.Rhodophyta-Hildenbrandia_rubra.ctg14944.p1 GENE.Plantae.Rhodophyta-Hildenbrandia_rubra.ctg14944~~Plantae.Rhodophyta-Hildenbrandia_rubra.ctg14944.p1  ORF type:complete len:551 (+),score=85.21 Plantae.Rhodophyta-Hildenbrandia_rubra.ctg14944:219-1871(+)